jgi:hypothetical protein
MKGMRVCVLTKSTTRGKADISNKHETGRGKERATLLRRIGQQQNSLMGAARRVKVRVCVCVCVYVCDLCVCMCVCVCAHACVREGHGGARGKEIEKQRDATAPTIMNRATATIGTTAQRLSTSNAARIRTADGTHNNQHTTQRHSCRRGTRPRRCTKTGAFMCVGWRGRC